MAPIPLETRTVWDIARARADATPDQLGVADLHGHEETIGQLVARAERVAAGLHELGIGPGTRVSWQLPTIPDAVVVLLALARLGAVQNPLVPVYRAREVGSVLRQFEPQWFIVIPQWRGFDHLTMVNELVAEHGEVNVLALDGALPEGDPTTLPAPPDSAEEVRWIYTTSGTTAEPKCARHRDRSLVMAGRASATTNALSSDDVAAMPFPIAHIGGINNLCAYLLVGVRLVLLDPFLVETAAPVMRRYGVTVVGGGTAHYLAFINAQREHGDELLVPTLRCIVAGGGAKAPEIFYELESVVGARAVHGFGMTECPYLTSGIVTDTDEQLANSDGAPVLDNEVVLRDAAGNDVATGEIGEVYVRSPLLCDGYLDADMTAAAFTADGFYRTGDLAMFRPDGHIRVTGRIKDIIIRKGENISALDVELVVRDLAGVGDVAVIGVPDDERGERVCAVIELTPGASAPKLEMLRQHCVAKGLMMQKIPEQLEVVDALPRNAFLKVIKPELRKRFC
ncbi:MAG: class I adenylate-forming enzyme family protein [Acidimicrobiia bacterium]